MKNRIIPTIKRITWVSLSLITTLQANDTAFGGTGATPYPIEQPNIQMLSEKITISGRDLNNPTMNGSWFYQCDFLFKNNHHEPLTVQMGFPFPVDNEEFGNIAVPAGRQVKPGEALVYDFKVTAQGKSISTQRQKIAPNQEKGLFYKDAYLWKLTFSPAETVAIQHQYTTGATFDVMGFNQVSYVLKTGGLWQGGRIGQTQIEVIPNTPTRLCSELNKKINFGSPKPKGMKIIGQGKNRRYVWNLKKFSPKDDLSLCIQTGRNYIHYRVVYPLLQDDLARIHSMNKKQLALIRNTIYAQYGRQFETPQLQTYFNRQWWYEPNPAYTDRLLTAEDKKLIAVIKQEEDKKA